MKALLMVALLAVLCAGCRSASVGYQRENVMVNYNLAGQLDIVLGQGKGEALTISVNLQK